MRVVKVHVFLRGLGGKVVLHLGIEENREAHGGVGPEELAAFGIFEFVFRVSCVVPFVLRYFASRGPPVTPTAGLSGMAGNQSMVGLRLAAAQSRR